MIHAADPEQGRLFDPFAGLFSASARKILHGGWQSLFRACLLVLMPVRQLAQHFHLTMGRPTIELYSVAGLLFLQEAFDWTNEEALNVYLFRTDVQFALNLEPGAQMCLRTLERYRALFLEDDLAAQIMNEVTVHLVAALDLNIDKQRLDSTHIFSDMANFGRTRMMAVTIKRFLVQVQRHHPDDYLALKEDLRKRYAASQGKLFSSKGLSAEQRSRSRQQVAEDLRELINTFADHAGLKNRPSFQVLLTVFQEQCEIVNDKIVVKSKTGGNIIQNPSDPDATYDGHKGQGYQVQLVETCSEANEVQLIVSALPQTAVENDANALGPVLEDLQKNDLLPEELQADGAYGSDENYQQAAALGVELVSPVKALPAEDVQAGEADSSDQAMSAEPGDHGPSAEPTAVGEAASSASSSSSAAAPLPKLTMEDFAIDERTGKVQACPTGRIPLAVIHDEVAGTTRIEMAASDCASCPYRSACPIKRSKKGKYTLDYTASQRRTEERRREQDTDAFKERYRKRAGIESTNSGLKRKMGLGQLRIRGSPTVRHAILLRIAGWNMLRATASAKLRAMVLEKLRKLGLAGGLGALRARFLAVYRVWTRCRPSLWDRRLLTRAG